MELLILVLIIIGAAAWLSGYKRGKREGSRKAFGVGFDRGKRSGNPKGWLILIVVLLFLLILSGL